MVRKILVGVGVLVGLLVAIVATRASTFHVERSMTIAAPATVPFSYVENFRAWSAWSPYDKLDPEMKRTYAGPASGVGATYSWAGNAKAGSGTMTVLENDAPSRIVLRLEFTAPFQATNTATFSFTPVPEGTKVTWAMDGKNSFFGKAAGLVMNMDTLIGTDFETGLANLKSISEKAAGAHAHQGE